MKNSFSIYIHIPFCKQKCSYCHFYVVRDDEVKKKLFVDALKKEIELRKSEFQNKKLESIYFGGGTPSLLSPQSISEILELLPCQNCEITLECNPDSLDEGKMQEFHSIGINRVSMGVQSFEDDLLEILTRRHDARKAAQAILACQRAGFKNISIDLMYDIPHQSKVHFQNSLKRATSLPIHHLSLYNLTFEPGTPFYRRKAQMTPHIESHLDIALSHMESEGWQRYEISAFCKRDARSHHNLGYWKGRPFLGFGPSAHSYWNKVRFANISNLSLYQKKLLESELPIESEDRLIESARLRELLAIRLRVFEPLNLEEWPLEKSSLVSLQKLKEKGWLEQKGSDWIMTQRGALFYDSIAEELV